MSVHEASPAQHRFWLLEQLGPSGHALHVSGLHLRLDGPLDVGRLRRALQAVLGAHEILRSSFHWEGSRLMAEVVDDPGPEIAELGSRERAEWDEQRAVELLQDMAEARFDLGRGPVVRAALIANGPRETHLLMAAHHIVWDGWSNGILLRELSLAYAEGGERRPAPATRYWEYGARKRATLAGAGGERDLAYWRGRLEGLPPLARLDRLPDDADELPPVRRAELALDRRTVADAALFARTHGTSTTSAFVAALQAALHDCGLGDESCFGVVLADRSDPAFADVIGCLLNTVALRTSAEPGDSFARLLERTGDALADALRHAALPFETLVQQLKLGRGQGLVQCLLSIQDFPARRCEIAGVEAVLHVVPKRRGRVQPFATVVLEGGAPMLRFEWNGELAIPAEQLLDRWRAALLDGMRTPDAPLSAGGELAAPEPATTGRGRAPPVAPRLPATVPALLRARAEAVPSGAPAVLAADGGLSFGELLREMDAVADRLRAAGVRPGAAVGVVARRSKATLVAMLGVQAAGAACVLLDPTYPPDRLRFMIEDSGLSLVLSAEPAGGPWETVPTLGIDAGGEPRGPIAADGGAGEGVGWIFYTSGSTGRPKGVLLGHEAIVTRLSGEPIPWDAADCGCHKSSFSYGDSLWELLAPLVHGRPVVLVDDEAARDPRLLSRLIERHGVTHLLLVPALLGALVRLPEEDRARLAGLRYCIATGDRLTGALAERFYAVAPAATLVDVYGATECWEVCWHAVPRTVRAGDRIPIGSRMLDGAQIAIVDDALAPVARETPGELLVSGPGVSRGYVRRPELTAERFVQLEQPGGDARRAYRTGDIVVQHDDGTLELVGRRDLQVNLRGFRIELEEVEQWLRACSGIVDGALAARSDADGTVVGLTAFVIPANGEDPNVSALRGELGRHLPDHCVPSEWVRLAQLPLMSTGKLDRSALATLALCQPAVVQAHEDADPIAPRDAHEETLVRIWRELLGVERVGVTDDFFDLGGSSLLAVQVVIRVEEQLGREVPLRDFYRRPTIACLSEALRQ